MAASDDTEERAAEYALGTLSAAEREEAGRDMASDPDFAALVAAWERRLSPLALALAPIAAPSHLRARILAAIPAPREGGNIVQLRRKLTRWQIATAAVSAIAAALGGFILLHPQPASEGRFVAVLQAEGPGPAFLASVDLGAGTISVRTVGARPVSGKSYELWALGAGRDKPQSLGVLAAGFRIPANKLGKLDQSALGDTVFAVSIEPEGGSPTGQPTGPVAFTGKLVATE